MSSIFSRPRRKPAAMLAAHPDIDVLIAENEDGIVAAAKAKQRADFKRRVAGCSASA